MFKQGFLSLALMGAGVLGLSAVSANAVTLPVASQPVIQDGSIADNLVEVRHRRGHNAGERRELRRYWDRRRDGSRFLRRQGDYRHFYRGYYYNSPWWTLPLISGSIILGSQSRAYAGYGNDHVDWCEDRYRSYNVRTNTWVSYSGEIRQCRSPYL